MAEYDVDDLLEQAFKRVDNVDKNGSGSKSPMDDLVLEEAKKAGVSKSSESSSRRECRKSRSRSGSRDRNRNGRSPSRSPDRDRKRRRSGSRDGRKRDSSRDRRRSRTRSRTPERSRRRSSSRDRDRRRRRSPYSSRRRSRSRSPYKPRVIDHRESSPWDRDRRRSPPPRRLPGPERRDVMPFTARHSPPPGAKIDMTPEERDERTIFILQLSKNTKPRDLEEFFSSVGHIRDVRIITDSKTRRSKGIAYVEFWEREGVPLAMGLNGQKLLGAPLVIQMTCAERNRAAAAATMGSQIGFGLSNTTGPVKLFVSNLHPNITDEMLTAIFEPFGRIERCEIIKEKSGASKCFGFVVFRHIDEGKRALENLNGFELAGKNIRLTIDDEDQQRGVPPVMQQRMESDTLAWKSMEPMSVSQELLPPIATQPPMSQPQVQQQQKGGDAAIPAIATQCFMLSNMFDPSTETEDGWDLDVRDDVIEECNNNGGVVHIYVDKASAQGNVYVKCPNVNAAHRSVGALHGRWFAGKVITANYVPVTSYHDLFPEAAVASAPLQTRQR